jgi:signal peptidase I
MMTESTHSQGGTANPFSTLWLSPGQTIERIVAANPRQFVVVLAALGGIIGFIAQAAGGGWLSFSALLWLGIVVIGAVIGIVSLYFNGAVMGWIGRRLGGRASALEIRAAWAWSGVPAIVGIVIALAIGALGAPAEVTSLIALAFGFWSVIAFLVMLGTLEHFGFFRALVTWLLVLALPLGFRTLLFQPFNVPSAAMSPTLMVGDYFFVSKYAYGYTHYSLPYSPPLFSGRIFASEPRRGDVVVFRLPKNHSVDYVKRIVGLPGDRIQMKEGQLYINDTPIKREPLASFAGDDLCGTDTKTIKHWRETIDDGTSYETFDCMDNGFYDNTVVYKVPAGHYFMMGDNRDNSTDSRVLTAVGYVPFENIIGHVGMIFFSSPPGSGQLRFTRLGTIVK